MPITTRRVRHEIRFRRATVVSNTRITPGMARIVVETPDLRGFVSLGFDDHVKLFFPRPGQDLPTPTRGERGLEWPGEAPEMRDFTPRTFDAEAGRLTLDFVLHDEGTAGPWAAQAKPGDMLGVGGPRGSFVVEGTADWHLLIGDATALPAIARRIEELPDDTRIEAIIEVADAGEIQRFDTDADLTVLWLCRDRGQTLGGYLDTLEELPEGEGFVFVAAEAGDVAKARARMEALDHPGENLKASNYWHREKVESAVH